MTKIKLTSITRWNQLSSAHARDSDRAVVIWAGSYVETHLKNYLLSRLRPGKNSRALFETYKPLSTFAGCIGIGYAIEALSKWQHDELDRIRHVRNHFAHDPYQARFGDKEVAKYIAGLKSYDPFEIPGFTTTDASARTRYLEACGFICAQLEVPSTLLGPVDSSDA